MPLGMEARGFCNYGGCPHGVKEMGMQTGHRGAYNWPLSWEMRAGNTYNHCRAMKEGLAHNIWK